MTQADISTTDSILAMAKPKLASGLTLRKAMDRGMADHGWLKSAHTFSFADYLDRNHMQFENLRVINDDQVAPGKGFGLHPHKDAEIFSYVLEGELEHKDTLGNGSKVKAGGVQYMSAGTGVKHSEFNPSDTDSVKFLQVWLRPNVVNVPPRYETLDIKPEDKDGKLKLFLSHDGRNGSMHIRSNALIFVATLTGEQDIEYALPNTHKAWIQMAKGSMSVNGQILKRGDGLSVSNAGRLLFTQGQNADFLLFDLTGT